MSGSIRDLSKEPPPAGLTCEVLVIGSGPGGATAARVLAEAGREVVVLEEGGDRTGTDLTQRDGAMYDQLYMDRGGRVTEDLSVSVLQGRALGGGGVINVSDVVPIPDGVLRHWQKKHGLSDFSPETLAPFKAKALEDLSANRIPEAALNEANRRLRAGAEKLGKRGEVMLHNRVGCAGLGTCLLGCPLNAKRNPRFVSIPKAMDKGARFFLRARALRIHDFRSEVKRISVATLDEHGYHTKGNFDIRARVVIVAANAIGSAELLLRSEIGTQHVGKHLTLQPQLPITALFDERIRAFDGIPQAYAVTEFEKDDDPEHGLWGFRIEAVMGTPGNVASLLPLVGRAGKELMANYDRIAASLLLVPDGPSGTVRLGASAGHPIVFYRQAENHKARLREAIKEAARIYFAAGARRVLVPTIPPLLFDSEADIGKADSLPFAPATAPLISAHQQGSVRFAGSPDQGGADPDGQVFGTRGVYVFDSSGFPSSASSHTMTPILTVAHYLSAKLAQDQSAFSTKPASSS
ncbi:MAG: GMC family oxidoreductase [Polyangiaceae bacterium]|nr:GMC family oxidoreductase [Polyangiaceae bacterium]MCL4752682.1 GMC family oxidoreductase N-terminal domain-containing protein [Myxococcales bacterium]